MRRKLKVRARRFALRFQGSFRRELVRAPSEPMSFDMERGSDTLLIAFGGMRGQLGMPPFEFFKATGRIPVKRLFVRDLRQAWYHRGIPGHGETIDAVAASLLAIVQREGVRRLVVAGNSAGGYASLVFGTLLGADVALCFAPQTVLEPAVLTEMDDHRWDEQLGSLVEAGALDPGWADLRGALATARPLPGAVSGASRFEVFYDADFAIDRMHAERLDGLTGVNLSPREGGRHGIARDMRLSGELDHLLQDSLLRQG
jgi:hypothetical protein